MPDFTFILERLSSRAKNSLIAAQMLSEEQHAPNIGTEHLLYGIVAEKSSFAAEILDRNKLDAQKIHQIITEQKNTAPEIPWKPILSENLKLAIEKAAITASQFGYQFIGTEHFLYGLITTKANKSVQILGLLGVDVKDLENQLVSMFEQISKFPDLAEGEYHQDHKASSSMSYYTVDLTEKAKAGKLSPLVGRIAEVDRLVSILGRKTKNNPVLIGEAGVGKTAIVEGLAQRIVDGNIPEPLKKSKVLTLDLALMVAGSMFRGEFESRLKQLIEEVSKQDDVILFIDELHTLVGAGSGVGSMDASNILKPALARGDIRVIGATTFAEYKQTVEKDGALERRFQTIIVEEPDLDETIKILFGLRPSYEAHHKLKISDEAIRAAVALSDRYINGRHMPDKAVDILDEAAAIIRMAKIPSELESKAAQLKKALEDIVIEKQNAVLKQDFTAAIHLQSQEVILQKQYDEILAKVAKENSPTQDLLATDIAKTVSMITKVPLQDISEGDMVHLQNLEKRLSSHVLGQDEAISKVAKAVRRGRAGLSDRNRPLASFLFAGPSGVGKTELAKALATEVYGDRNSLIRVDMSELSEKHTVAKLIGAPAGYIGYGEGGMLTESVRRKPYSVVLFDEIEKAHPDVANVLLQILEDGQLTDSQGKKISFANTIIILTSNAGTSDPSVLPDTIGFESSTKEKPADKTEVMYEKIKNQVEEATREFFRPELLNRLDNYVIFHPLTKEHIRQIVKMHLVKLENKLKEQGLFIKYTPEVIKFLTDESFSHSQGARKVRQTIREHLEDELASLVISGATKNASNIFASAEEGKIKLTPKKAEAKKAKKVVAKKINAR